MNASFYPAIVFAIESFAKFDSEEREIRGGSDDDCSSKYNPIRGGIFWLNRFQSTDRYFQLEPSSTAWSSTLFFEGESRRRCSWRGNEGFGEKNTESAHHSQRSTAGEIKCIGYFARWSRIGRLNVPPIPRNRNFRPSSFKSKHSIFSSNGPFFFIIPHLNFIIEIS